MKATKINQTVPLENPESAQRMESSGLAATRLSAAAAVIPRRPATGPGIGSVIRAAMTATESAK